MKINIIYKIILVMMLIFISTTSVCFADAQHLQQQVLDGGDSVTPSGESSGGGSVGYPSLELYEPEVSGSSKATDIISKILGAITVVGVIIVLIAIALIGYHTLIGSASDKAFEKEKMIGVAIGASIMIGGSSLAQMLISMAETL